MLEIVSEVEQDGMDDICIDDMHLVYGSTNYGFKDGNPVD